MIVRYWPRASQERGPQCAPAGNPKTAEQDMKLKAQDTREDYSPGPSKTSAAAEAHAHTHTHFARREASRRAVVICCSGNHVRPGGMAPTEARFACCRNQVDPTKQAMTRSLVPDLRASWTTMGGWITNSTTQTFESATRLTTSCCIRPHHSLSRCFPLLCIELLLLLLLDAIHVC